MIVLTCDRILILYIKQVNVKGYNNQLKNQKNGNIDQEEQKGKGWEEVTALPLWPQTIKYLVEWSH